MLSGATGQGDGQPAGGSLAQAQQRLRALVLDTVPSPHSRRNYGKALDDLFAFSAARPLTRALLLEYRASIDHLSGSTINVRLSAIRKLVGEARRLGMVGPKTPRICLTSRISGRRGLAWGTGSPANRPGICSLCRTAPPSKENATT